MKTVEKAVELLFLLARSSEPLRVDAIARQLKMPRSTTYRFMQSLQKYRLVASATGDGKYHLGIRTLEFYQGFLNVYSLREVALPYMRELTARTGNTSYLCIRSDRLAVCVESVESPEALISRLSVGRALPLHAGAPAKVLLAYLPEAEQRQVLADKLIRYTPFTMTDRRQLRRELQRIRAQGYSYTNQEVDPGSRAVAVPLHDFWGQVVAVLGIAGPTHKFREDRLRCVIDVVRHYGRIISEKLGGPVEKEAYTVKSPAHRAAGYSGRHR